MPVLPKLGEDLEESNGVSAGRNWMGDVSTLGRGEVTHALMLMLMLVPSRPGSAEPAQ